MYRSAKLLYITFFFCISYQYVQADNWVRAYDYFNKNSSAQTSLQLPTGEIIIGAVSFDDDAIIIKTDANGKTIKEHRITKTRNVKKILLTNDNQLFICGMTDSIDSYGNNVYWMKLDMNLNVIWSQVSIRNFRDVCESAIQYSDGTFYVVGYGSRTGNSLSDRDAMIYHIDIDGDLIDARISSNFGADYFNNIAEAPDGSLIVIGTKLYQVAMDMYLARFSKDLVQMQTKTYGGLEDESAYDLLIDNGSLYVLGGTHSEGAGKYDVVLSKFDLNFSEITTKTYGSAIDESAMSMAKLNNEIVIVGNLDTVFVKDSTYVPTKLFFIKTDLNLNYLNAYYFKEHSRVNTINNLSKTNTNEIIVAFTTSYFSKNGVSDWAILKTDSFNLGCCNYIQPINFVENTISFSSRSQSFVFNTTKNTLPLGAATGLESSRVIGYCGLERDTTNIKNINNSTFCKNQPIKFNANTSITPIFGTWIFGDTLDIIDTAGNDVIYKFDSLGVFNVYYIAYFQCNSDTDTISIEIINSKPYVVELMTSDLCLNKPITFNVKYSSEDINKYHWNFNDPFATNDSSLLDQPNYTFTKPGKYSVYLFSETFCGAKIDSILIDIPDKSNVEIDKTVSTYCKNTIVPFNINITEIPSNSSWNFGDPSSSNNTTTGNIAEHTYSKPGQYICTVISDFYCASDTDTMHITILDYFPQPAKINYTGLCANEPFQFDVDDNLNNPNYFWEIQKDATVTNYYSKNFTHQFLTQGEYTIRVSVSDNDCNKGIDTIKLNVAEFTIAGINSISDPCLQGVILEPTNTASNVLWKLSDGYISNEKILTYSFPSSGDYEITLITNPNSNCADSTTVSIPFIKENANGGIYIPEAFSPNGDGKNDLFIIENTTNNPCKLVSFKVYDRWGKIMHSVDKFNPFIWDGKFNGNTVTPGTYIGFLETENSSSSFVINVVY